MQATASQNAPSPNIVIPHFLFGGLTWLVISALIFSFPESLLQHYFNPKLLAITHLLVLGWITMIIFGALYQLIPVIMEAKLFSEKLAVISFISLAVGSILLSLSFWNFWFGEFIYIASTLLLIAVILFVVNVILTALKSTKKSIEIVFILSSATWLLLTVTVGVILVINLTSPFLSVSHLQLLKLHAHAGIVGWIIQLIIGVACKLLPMFMVSHNLNILKLKLAFYLINSGLIIGLSAIYYSISIAVFIGVLAVVAGIISFLTYLFEAYKKRVKKKLDIGMKQSAISFIVIIAPIILVFLIFSGIPELKTFSMPLIIAYASSILVGFVSSLIMGQAYKTLPFIVWLKVYRDKIGKGKIPFPKDLYSEKIATVQLWSFSAGFTAIFAGILAQNELLIKAGALVLFVSIFLFNLNLLKIVFHKPVIK